MSPDQTRRVWTRVDTPQAARLCLNPEYMHLLGLLMTREWSATALAGAAQRPLNATHHRLGTLLATGLIRVTRLEPRRGRPIRHYRAASEALIIPYHLTPLSRLEDLISLHEDTFSERFRQAVVQAGVPLVRRDEDIAVRLYRSETGVAMDVTPSAGDFDLTDLLRPDAPALTVHWGVLHLSRAEAKALQTELHDLLGRYGNRSGPQGYLFRVNLAPDRIRGKGGARGS